MTGKNSKENSDAAVEAKMRKQRKKILEVIATEEKNGKYEVVFYEEMFIENKTYFESKGYTVRNYGGPQNTFYNLINWKNAE